ncbi:unnamed protein product [Caenorhabditis bovis]|uniref:DUF19 domain-containing protein n=1 Tax=Caenorhabditis bovis TaxID=2654633 RepID=A0A8S1EV82_9PELO|nr:unnamed protein product [Caenorhabditis bovis]
MLIFLIFLSTSFSFTVQVMRFKRDFMYVTDGNETDAKCFETCQSEFKAKFEYTFNQSLDEFYDFPFHPIVLQQSSLQPYCTLSEKKILCFSEKCNDYTADTSFSPSNFVCSFKRGLFDKSIKCLSQTEPITFLKCDHECHVDSERLQEFVPSKLETYEKELDKLCRFQTCYMKCMKPIVKEMCTDDDSQSAIDVVESYVQWHADDISDWHAMTGNEELLPKSCRDLVKTPRKSSDPVLQLISEVK